MKVFNKRATTGDRVWYRDSWGIPTSAIVDFVDEKSQTIIGMNSRNAFVRGPVECFFRSLVSCESVLKCVN